MAKIKLWKESKNNTSLDMFIKKHDGKTCPNCGAILEEVEESNGTIKICPNCDYTYENLID